MTVLTRAIAASRKLAVSADFSFTIPGGMNINLRAAAVSAGWDGVAKVTATVTANVGSTSVGTPALVVDGSFPASVTLIVASGIYLVGRGGSSSAYALTNEAGGPALSALVPVSVQNNGIIGGGGGAGAYNSATGYLGQGGAGLNVGTGFSNSSQYTPTITTGGNYYNTPGGPAGQAGGDATTTNFNGGAGGGGGGLGGKGGDCDGEHVEPGDYYVSGGDAGGDYQGIVPASYTYGGAPGAAVLGNNKVTWVTVGTRYGAINA